MMKTNISVFTAGAVRPVFIAGDQTNQFTEHLTGDLGCSFESVSANRHYTADITHSIILTGADAFPAIKLYSSHSEGVYGGLCGN